MEINKYKLFGELVAGDVIYVYYVSDLGIITNHPQIVNSVKKINYPIGTDEDVIIKFADKQIIAPSNKMVSTYRNCNEDTSKIYSTNKDMVIAFQHVFDKGIMYIKKKIINYFKILCWNLKEDVARIARS